MRDAISELPREIAEHFNKTDSQSEGSKINTFYHELTHSILKTMGETELNDNEKFVCCFSSFLSEAMGNAYFEEEEEEIEGDVLLYKNKL